MAPVTHMLIVEHVGEPLFDHRSSISKHPAPQLFSVSVPMCVLCHGNQQGGSTSPAPRFGNPVPVLVPKLTLPFVRFHSRQYLLASTVLESCRNILTHDTYGNITPPLPTAYRLHHHQPNLLLQGMTVDKRYPWPSANHSSNSIPASILPTPQIHPLPSHLKPRCSATARHPFDISRQKTALRGSSSAISAITNRSQVNLAQISCNSSPAMRDPA